MEQVTPIHSKKGPRQPETAAPRFAPLPPAANDPLPGSRVKGACGAATRALRAP
jgi:hypothetical protein